MTAILVITALSGVLGITDLSPLGNMPQWAYGELGIHTAFIVWKAKVENSRKFKDGMDGQIVENKERSEENI